MARRRKLERYCSKFITMPSTIESEKPKTWWCVDSSLRSWINSQKLTESIIIELLFKLDWVYSDSVDLTRQTSCSWKSVRLHDSEKAWPRAINISRMTLMRESYRDHLTSTLIWKHSNAYIWLLLCSWKSQTSVLTNLQSKRTWLARTSES